MCHILLMERLKVLHPRLPVHASVGVRVISNKTDTLINATDELELVFVEFAMMIQVKLIWLPRSYCSLRPISTVYDLSLSLCFCHVIVVSLAKTTGLE